MVWVKFVGDGVEMVGTFVGEKVGFVGDIVEMVGDRVGIAGHFWIIGAPGVPEVVQDSVQFFPSSFEYDISFKA